MLETRYNKLIKILKDMKRTAVAFSGGVDSTFLLAAAKKVLNDKVIAITVETPYIARWEISEAKKLASDLEVTHRIIELPIPESIRSNPENRCYLCKKELFSHIKNETINSGFKHVCEGTNSDDLHDFRPGRKALEELNIQTPLMKSGLTKDDIRILSKKMNIPTWNKPSYACLLTRFPYNITLSQDAITRVESAETFLINTGFKSVRIRSHGNLARIEVEPHRIKELLEPKQAQLIRTSLRKMGFLFVTVDIGGYRMGSFHTDKSDGDNNE